MTSYGTTIQNVSFTWESTNTSVATVSSTGLATALEAGSTTIRAMAGGVSGSAMLTVTEPPPPPPTGKHCYRKSIFTVDRGRSDPTVYSDSKRLG